MAAFQKLDPWGPQPAALGSGYYGALDDVSSVLKPGGGVFDSITGAQLLSAGSSVLSSALAPSPAGPSNAVSGNGYMSTSFDNSGWTVATGKASAEGGDRGIDLTQMAILGIAALVVIGWVRTKKH